MSGNIFFITPISGYSVAYAGLIFSTFGGIFGYYFTTSFLEESGKYIASLSFSGRKETQVFQGFMILSASVAIGFSFFENIAYTIASLSASGVSGNLISLVFMRSIFSTTLHVLVSLLLSYAFWNMFFFFSKEYKRGYRAIGYALFALVIHAFFNIGLTFGYTFFFIPLLFGVYFLLVYIFHSPEQEI